ncbi:MAG: hypothetical protein U5K74_05965 [Gemmatimonadaceae bacterium]|nr:hypothetical protein [Gemmatimonadaceae bacterium]
MPRPRLPELLHLRHGASALLRASICRMPNMEGLGPRSSDGADRYG